MIGIGKRRAGNPADAQMIMMMRIGVPARSETAQAVNCGELGKNQGDHMVPAFEALVIGIRVVNLHDCLELPPRDRFEQAAKDAIPIAHVRFSIF